MIRLHEKTPEEILAKHLLCPWCDYAADAYHGPRIQAARNLITKSLLELQGNVTAHPRRRIIELGCNSADISGFFSWGHEVHGYEVAAAAIEKAAHRYPWLNIHAADFLKEPPGECDILVLCEILEHLADPLDLVRQWMPKAKYCVLSSPLLGDRGNDVSGGEHAWSFSEPDFEEFFSEGGHEVLDSAIIPAGQYRIYLARSRRKDSQLSPTNTI